MLMLGLAPTALPTHFAASGVSTLVSLLTRFGQSASHNAGTEADFIVDPSGAGDFTTIQAAIDAAEAAGGSQVIALRGGTYRESAASNIKGADTITSLTIKRYAAERPVISGGELITGWTQCDSGDEAVVGASYPGIWKATVSKADYPVPGGKFWRTIMRQGQHTLSICGIREPTRTTPDFFYNNIDQFYREGAAGFSFTTRGPSAYYDTVTHAGVIDSYTDAQLDQAVAAVYVVGNNADFIEVESVSNGVLTLDGTRDVPPFVGGDGAGYALFNVLPAMQQGEWGYRDNGDATITFYVWPLSQPLIHTEIAVRQRCLELARSLNNVAVTVDGVDFEMIAGDFDTGWALEVGYPGGLSGLSTAIRQCRFRHIGEGRGFMQDLCEHGVTMEDCTFTEMVGFGMQVVPSPASGFYNHNNRYRRLLFQDISNSPMRLFGIRDTFIEDISLIRTSAGGHANTFNFYSGSDNVVFKNVVCGLTDETRLFTGYGANQDSCRALILNCILSPNLKGRGYVDQNDDVTALPVAAPGNRSYFINNLIPHMPDRMGAVDTGGLTIGRATMDWDAHNNIVPYILENSAGTVRRNNILTNASAVGHASEVVAKADDLHTDPAAFRFEAETGSILNTMAGHDVESIIAEWEARFTDENLRTDVFKRAWNPASPGVGPFGGNLIEAAGPPPPPDPAQPSRDTLLQAITAAGGQSGYANFVESSTVDDVWTAADQSDNGNDWVQANAANLPLAITERGAVLGNASRLPFAINGGTFTMVFGVIRDRALTVTGTLIANEALARIVHSQATSTTVQGAVVTVIVDATETVCATWGDLFDVIDPLADGQRAVIVAEAINAASFTALSLGRSSGNCRGLAYGECAVLNETELGADLAQAKADAITVCQS